MSSLSQSERWARLSQAWKNAFRDELIEDAPDPLPTTEGILAGALRMAAGDPKTELQVALTMAVVGELARVAEALDEIVRMEKGKAPDA